MRTLFFLALLLSFCISHSMPCSNYIVQEIWNWNQSSGPLYQQTYSEVFIKLFSMRTFYKCIVFKDIEPQNCWNFSKNIIKLCNKFDILYFIFFCFNTFPRLLFHFLIWFVSYNRVNSTANILTFFLSPYANFTLRVNSEWFDDKLRLKIENFW